MCYIPHRPVVFTGLSVDMGSLALKDFLRSESSWLCTGMGRMLALTKEGMQSMEAAGKSQERKRCAAWVAHRGGRHWGTWREVSAGGYIHCVLAPMKEAALAWERNQWVRIKHWLISTKQSRHLLVLSILFYDKARFSFGKECFTILSAHCELSTVVPSFPKKWACESS